MGQRMCAAGVLGTCCTVSILNIVDVLDLCISVVEVHVLNTSFVAAKASSWANSYPAFHTPHISSAYSGLLQYYSDPYDNHARM